MDIAPEFLKKLSQVKVIIVGGSAGGVEVMLKLFSTLPAAFQVPIIVVLHMPDNHESNIAQVFQQLVMMPVREIEDKAAILAGTMYFAPSGYHTLIESNHSFALSCDPAVNHSRPAIDVLMSSAADVYGHALLGILLSGANNDGAKGMHRIHQRGGVTIVQEPEEAKLGTMPGEAIKLHMPDAILPITRIKSALLTIGRLHASR